MLQQEAPQRRRWESAKVAGIQNQRDVRGDVPPKKISSEVPRDGVTQASNSVGSNTHLININGVQVEALLDNGSDLNLLSRETWNRLAKQLPQLKSHLQLGPVQQFQHADLSWSSTPAQLGQVNLSVQVPMRAAREITAQFIIMDCLSHPVILGHQTLQETGIQFAFRSGNGTPQWLFSVSQQKDLERAVLWK